MTRVQVAWLAVFALLAMAGTVRTVAAQELRIALAAEPSAMDPHYHNLTPNNSILSHVFERLVETAPDGKLVPGLALSWKATGDTVWELKLRPNVKWHDGTPFTADDVMFTFERAPDVPDSPSSFASSIKGKTLKKLDDLTVHIITTTPAPLVPNELSNILIVSKKNGTDAKTEDYNSGRAMTGTGAYKFVSFLPGDKIELVRNEDYWGDKPAWSKLTFRTLKPGPARIAALLAGETDLIEDVPASDVERIKKEPKVELAQAVSRGVIYFHLDQARDETPFIKARDGSAIRNPLKDLRVRQALSKAINREAIASRVMEGMAVPASQFLADPFFGVSKTLKPLPYDPEGAKKLLADAGMPNGFKMTLHAPSGRYANDVKIAEAVAQMFTRVGVETVVEALPPAQFFQRASTGNNGGPEFSFILAGWNTDTGEVSGSLKPLVATYDKDKGMGVANRGRYSNPELDKLITEALATVDDVKREVMLARASELAILDVALIPSHHPTSSWAMRKGLSLKPRADGYTLVTGVSGQ
jgi:peptide/nickel transport system substrate-binding protein